MAKRYGIFPIIGDGQTVDTAFRSAVDDLPTVNSKNVIKTDETGHPVFNFAFTAFGTTNLQSAQQISNSYVFPDYPLDGQLSGMEAATRSAMKQNVEAYDMDGDGTHFNIDLSDLSKSYRDVLVSLYLQFDPLLPVVSFANFDASEPEA